MKNAGDLYEMLMELEIEQIEKVRDEFLKRHEDRKTYSLICQSAINTKRDEQDRKEFIEIIESVKIAPASATNTEQGNETR